MTLKDIKNVSFIISEGYNEGGVFINDLWIDICNSNPNFKLSQTFESLIMVLRFSLDNDIAELIKYDEKEKGL